MKALDDRRNPGDPSDWLQAGYTMADWRAAQERYERAWAKHHKRQARKPVPAESLRTRYMRAIRRSAEHTARAMLGMQARITVEQTNYHHPTPMVAWLGGRKCTIRIDASRGPVATSDWVAQELAQTPRVDAGRAQALDYLNR